MLEKDEHFKVEATYYNVSANILFMGFVGFLLTFYAWRKSEWGSLTKSLLICSILLIMLAIGLFFSSFSKRQFSIKGDMLFVGKRAFHVSDIERIECVKIGRTFYIYGKGMDESLTLQLRRDDRLLARKYIQKWCESHHIVFKE